MRTIGLVVCAFLACGASAAIVDFQQMRVKELQAYLAAHKTTCVACTEKHEFVTKAMEVHEETSRAKSKTKKPQHQGRSRSSLPSSSIPSTSEIKGFLTLLVVFMLFLWKSCWAPVRRMLYSRKTHGKGKPVDVITCKPVRDPYELRCCGNVCERKTLAKWMQKSKLVRLSHGEGLSVEIQPLAQCPLCRGVFEPSAVRSLLWEFKLDRPHGDVPIESDIYDPAFARGEVARQHLFLMKTQDDLIDECRDLFGAVRQPADNQSNSERDDVDHE